ncbi:MULTISPECIES: FecCD family ABC transporter permease [Staphylococcus]|jgi:iron complex transport system permease protein|uniref:Probable heme-iron transport system permease protein IsdF n=1 Tax=Staphylococcus nepalensis TaxID=214473 RepID=A0A291JM13_9STAP|nr:MULTISPECIES: iron ABC transporter permease [Staphylococcus]VDG67902.1 ferrichrome ABC transporter permease [Lacrimispora indolis]ATH60904.1 iron ABC transporter permease [Staphylococcus nepalensis]ATH65936.1 iron ABC transporter permease [Staphylococcus nepalensis]MBO1206513.1 iron ABC transporter permease [Staphylococcus nepalensis]MBO1214325.1 iron ABC transporter permease [Staphylococcus nepalensis]
MIDPKLRHKQLLTMAILIILVLLACAWSMTSGEYKMSVGTFFKTLIGQGEYTDTLILMEFRLPRMIITILAGAALAMSGAIIQSVTKNPLAEPGILGINAGSGFAIALFIVVGQVSADNFVYVLPFISMLGGIITALIIFSFSYNRGEGITPASMVLVGVGMATALSGGSLTLMSTFDEDQSEFIASWLAGNIWGDEWAFVIAFLPWVIVLIPFLLLKSNVLNLLNTHQYIAQGVGVKIGKERIVLLLIAVVLSSAAVSVAGAIGFIGLLGPHIAKSIVGPRHQLFLPISIFIGAFLLVLADTVGQIILQPSGIPAGIVVSIIGAPYFLYLMYKTKSV